MKFNPWTIQHPYFYSFKLAKNHIVEIWSFQIFFHRWHHWVRSTTMLHTMLIQEHIIHKCAKFSQHAILSRWYKEIYINPGDFTRRNMVDIDGYSLSTSQNFQMSEECICMILVKWWNNHIIYKFVLTNQENGQHDKINW